MAKQDDIGGLIESWMQGQQKIWNDWMGMVGTGSGDATQVWQQGLARWRESMDSTLDAQAQAMTSWMEQTGKSAGDSPDARKWAAEGGKMVEQWTRAQRSLWDQWFQTMGKLAESGAVPPGQDQLKQCLAGWEQVGKQMQALHEQWTSSLAGAANKSASGTANKRASGGAKK